MNHIDSVVGPSQRVLPLDFLEPRLHESLVALDEVDLDRLGFGVIAFDGAMIVTRYNAVESGLAGLARSRVVGFHVFDVVAPCMDNALIRRRFEDAATTRAVLDVAIPYILTLRMRPTRVTLRLLLSPQLATRYVLVHRLP